MLISHLPAPLIASLPAPGAQASWFSLSNTRTNSLTHSSTCKVCLVASSQLTGRSPSIRLQGGEVCRQNRQDTFSGGAASTASRLLAKRGGDPAIGESLVGRRVAPSPGGTVGPPQGRHHCRAGSVTSYKASSSHPQGWGALGLSFLTSDPGARPEEEPGHPHFGKLPSDGMCSWRESPPVLKSCHVAALAAARSPSWLTAYEVHFRKELLGVSVIHYRCPCSSPQVTSWSPTAPGRHEATWK